MPPVPRMHPKPSHLPSALAGGAYLPHSGAPWITRFILR
ncbi:hypothetical protein AtDm6_0819 [Acetobacter tropicalis]|uniref:Uncharacterized protein n=1 Tax=Acetobacter tropicalis TaxID=104102 RepID=A0A095B8N9_9PROT|nr:hypothetical protein AtDm6_0819 [Acetobacter tropicalis]